MEAVWWPAGGGEHGRWRRARPVEEGTARTARRGGHDTVEEGTARRRGGHGMAGEEGTTRRGGHDEEGTAAVRRWAARRRAA